MKWPWVSRALYRNVLRQLAVSRRQAEGALEDLRLERAENRLAERHWSNQFLRKMNAYPQQQAKENTDKPIVRSSLPVYDSGELAAVIEEATRLGISIADAREMFAREKGIEVSKLVN